MVKRADTSIKYTRWTLFLSGPFFVEQVECVLRQVVATRPKTHVETRELSNTCVEVVWRSGVAYDSAMRLIAFAKRQDVVARRGCFQAWFAKIVSREGLSTFSLAPTLYHQTGFLHSVADLPFANTCGSFAE